MSFRTSLIALNVAALCIVVVYLLWRVVSVRRNPSTKEPENQTPFLADEELEGPRLERALGWSLLFVLVVALALPLYFLFEPSRQDRAAATYDDQAVERGATLFANDQSPAYDSTKSLLCADCHGTKGGGGTAPFVLRPELDICDNPENQSNPDVPQCLPVQVGWAAPALNSVLLRFTEEQVTQIITYGRPGTPMPAWGVASGKGVLESQSISDLVAFLESIQITSQQAKNASTKALDGYKDTWAKNVTDQQATLEQKQADLAKAQSSGASADAIAALQAAVDQQTAVVASAEAFSAQVQQMSDGEILFRLSCARCHTKGASYYDPNNLELPPPPEPGSGAFGPNLTDGAELRQFPGVAAGEQQQFDWVALGAPANEGYGVRGISSGRMPHFVNMLSEKQIKEIVAYERSL